MNDETRPLERLLQQWLELGASDRRGILRRLTVEQQLVFQRVLASSTRERIETAARAQRFRACSPWLGELLDACEEEAPGASALKPLARAALLAGHRAASESHGLADTPPSLAALGLSLLRSVRERF